VYGKHVLLPIEFQIKTFRTAVQVGMNLDEAQQQRLLQLNELDETRKEALQRTTHIQEQRTKWHDKYLKKKKFQQGDWALLYGNRFKDFKGKLTTRWMGPYEIDAIYDNGSIRIKTIDEKQTPLLVNGHRLRVYNKTLSKEEFLTCILQNSDMKMISKEGDPPTDPH
jgi:hypothetical protein